MPYHTAEFLDPTSIAFRPTPTIPSGGGLSVFGRATINLPAQNVYDALLDIEKYSEWSTFIKSAKITKRAAGQDKTDGKLQKGTRWHYEVQMSASGRINGSNEMCVEVMPLQVAEEHKPATTMLRWVYDVPFPVNYFLKAEHVNEITDLGDGTTEYVHWETFSGLGATFVKASAGDWLRKKFNAWPEELKAYLEKGKKKEREGEEAGKAGEE